MEIKNYTRGEVEALLKVENLTMKRFLQSIQDQGYLLHGSPSCTISKFEPQAPGDLRGGWTAQKGVYATSTEQPIIFSLIHKNKVESNWYFEVGRNSTGEVLYGVSQDVKDSNAIQPGCIYIFEKAGFTENPNNSGEWMSPTPVVPVGKVPTDPCDLENPIRTVEIPPEDQDWDVYEPKFLD
jgi:hypothetical protein